MISRIMPYLYTELGKYMGFRFPDPTYTVVATEITDLSFYLKSAKPKSFFVPSSLRFVLAIYKSVACLF
jgi:hypothetical protein